MHSCGQRRASPARCLEECGNCWRPDGVNGAGWDGTRWDGTNKGHLALHVIERPSRGREIYICIKPAGARRAILRWFLYSRTVPSAGATGAARTPNMPGFRMAFFFFIYIYISKRSSALREAYPWETCRSVAVVAQALRIGARSAPVRRAMQYEDLCQIGVGMYGKVFKARETDLPFEDRCEE